MILVVDVGNTNIEFGVLKGDALLGSFRMGTNRESTSDEIGFMIIQFLSFYKIDPEKIQDVVVASVVPQVMHSLMNAIKRFVGKVPLIVGDNLPINVVNLYDNPKEVGADRLVNALSAVRKYGAPLIVVDFGTATTFDAVDKDGSYLGGAIYPGIKISMDALFARAAKLPKIELVDPGVSIGKNTSQSMQVGAIHGYTGAVLHICQQMKKSLGDTTKIIATGGLAVLFAEQGVFDYLDKTITLDGLRMIYEDYQKSQTKK